MPNQTLRSDPKSAVPTPAPLSIEAAIRLVHGWTDQSKANRAGLASALTTVAAMAGLPAASMLLTPASLRLHVLNRSPAAWGVKATSKSNIRSRLRFVLRRLDLIEPADLPIAAIWQTLLGRLQPLHRAGLTGFARFCSAGMIAPGDVDSASFAGFTRHLETRTLTANPRKRVSGLRRSWNSACGTIAGWPSKAIPQSVDPDQYILPPQAFADSFIDDLNAFGCWLGGSILDASSLDISRLESSGMPDDTAAPPTLRRRARATTVALRQSHCRWAASALAASGVAIGTLTSLASLFTPLTRAFTIIQFLYRRAGDQPSAAGMHVAQVLRIVAQHYLKLPAEPVSWITTWGKDVTLKYQGITEKNERSIAEVMVPACERRLIELPEAFMAAAHERLASDPREAAGLALRALAIEILTTYPFRLANLRGLRFDRHLHRADPRGPVTGILISPEEVKNTHKIVLPLSARIGWFIEQWTTRFRGIIAAPDCPYLFPGYGTGNQAMTPQGLRAAIKDAMAEFVGVVLTPHQFRHLAAERFLLAHPGHIEALSQLLGHKSPTTTRRSYVRDDSTAAAVGFDALLTDRRVMLRRDAPAAKPGLPFRKPRRGHG